MGTVRIFTPENRLSDIFGGPKDPTAETLEQRACEQVAKLGPVLKAHVAAQVAEIERIAGEPEEIIFAECQSLGDAALDICEVAGAAGMTALGQVARGIATMVDALVSHGVWHTDALKLHVDALTMFATSTEMAAAETQQVLARLKVLRDGIGVPD